PSSPGGKLHIATPGTEPALIVEQQNEVILKVEEKNIGIKNPSPKSTLSHSGSYSAPVVIVPDETTEVSPGENDYMFLFLGGDDKNILLPPAASCPGRIYEFYRNGTPPINYDLVFNLSGSDQLDGLTSQTFGPGIFLSAECKII